MVVFAHVAELVVKLFDIFLQQLVLFGEFVLCCTAVLLQLEYFELIVQASLLVLCLR
jgi:hypothetical protein